MSNNRPIVELEGTRLIFSNLRGAADDYNAQGRRHTGVVINDEGLAKRMADDGWNIKTLQPTDQHPDIAYWTDVIANYNSRRQPEIYLVDSLTNDATLLTEDMVGMIDSANIMSVDVKFQGNPSSNPNNVYKFKGYISEMFVVVEPSRFARKYNIKGASGNPRNEDLPYDD